MATIVLFANPALPAGAAAYPSFQIAPARIELDAAHTIGQLTMNSLSAQNVIFDLQTVAWRQDGDADEFTPTDALAVVPPVYEIAPFRSMLVRVGMRNASSVETELAFQVRFREVIAPGTNAEARTLDAPVFIAPRQRTGDVDYELTRSGSEQATLNVRDGSNVHVYVGRLTIRSGERVAFSGSVDAYVLAGNARSFAIKLDHPIEGTTAEITIGDGDAEQTVRAAVR